VNLGQTQTDSFVMINEIKIQLRITSALKMIELVRKDIEDIKTLYKLINFEKTWRRK